MKVQVESVSPVEKKVTIEVDPSQVAQELDRAYAGLGRRVKLKGFRPGKAPRTVLERHFKEQVENEVIETLVAKSFRDAVRDEKLSPVAPPNVSLADGKLGEGKSLKYTARVEVKPKVTLGDYKGVEVTRKAPDVTDSMVSDELTRMQDSLAQLVPVEGRDTAQPGDLANIDYDGTIAGMPFDGGKGEDVTVKVNKGEFIDGDIEALEGKRIGETLEMDYAFPATYRMEELRGKVAHFKVTLKALKTRQMPGLDDEFAKDLGIPNVETIDALRTRIREDLEAREKRRVEMELREAIIKETLKKNDFEVPASLVERAIDGMLQGAAERFRRQGLDIRQLNLDLARLRGDLREQALLQVKGALLLEAVAESEKIAVSDEDFQAELAKIATEMKVPLAKIQTQLKQSEQRADVEHKIREDKALAFLISAAKIS